ncbi:MAG: hypothetical protein K2W96_12595 [Gemmataceae bacterium]|nr:hypothetical protein [Gemmataceae bacterium]
MHRLTCQCGRVLGYEDRHRGKTVKCSGCGQPLSIPESDALRLVEEELPPPPRPDPRDFEDDEEERRREHRKRRARPTKTQVENGALGRAADFLIDHNWIIWVLMILGVVGIIFGYREGALSSASSSGPQTVALADLIANGPGDNKHVLVTDAAPANPFVSTVSVRKGESGQGKPWSAVYVPLVPVTPQMRADLAAGRFQEVRPSAIRAILVSYKATNQAELSALFAQGTVKGTVVNSITSLGSKVQDLLKGSFRDTDFDKVLIIEEGRAPMSRSLALFLFAGGIALIAIALGLGLLALLFKNSL